MANLFPSLKPKIANKQWFSVDDKTIVESDAELTKQELEYSLSIEEEVKKGQNIIPIGKVKEKNEDLGEEDELDDDDESNEEMDEDTDEFDAASNELDSIDEDQMAIL